MQFSNEYYRKKQDSKIVQDIEYNVDHIRSVSISAVIIDDQFVSYLLS